MLATADTWEAASPALQSQIAHMCRAELAIGLHVVDHEPVYAPSCGLLMATFGLCTLQNIS